MALGKILLGAVAAAAAYGLILVEFPDQVSTYAPQIIPRQLSPLIPPPLPKARPEKTAFWLDQNWRLEDRLWAHHASQGTKTFPIPYSWFVALEQPYIWLIGQPELLSDSAYLARMGFVPSPRTGASEAELRANGFGKTDAPQPPAIAPSTTLAWRPAENPDRLPVGFARLQGAPDPMTGALGPDSDFVGLTCAACHTGHVDYKGVTLRVDGGPAMVDLGKFQSVLVLSLVYTLKAPGRFERFAERVLGAGASEAQKAELKRKLGDRIAAIIAVGTKIGEIERAAGQKYTDEGLGRLDALNRIGNQVFFWDMAQAKLGDHAGNYHTTDAPVRFPQLWNVSWFLWAEYDGSIEHPLIRNAGEALGVQSPVDLADGAESKNLFRSNVVFENLFWIEDLLRGPNPFASSAKPAFGGLAAPKWPSALFPGDAAWKVDPQKVSRGRVVYAELCASCHLGPVDDPDFDKAFPQQQFWTSKHWVALGGAREKFLALPQIPVGEIGTDPAQANVLLARMVEMPEALGIDLQRDFNQRRGCAAAIPAVESRRIPFAYALMEVVDRVLQKWMDDERISPADRAAILGARKNCPNPAPGKPFYRARPLNGIWAAAPFLHNGSVPSLYWLLRPAAERPRQFCLGASDYDPKAVGFAAQNNGKLGCAVGETLFSTFDAEGKPISGNSNGGHSFDNAGPKPGVIGRGLSEEERYDLIEYLKTL
ncbi:di-heme-cytochrome C peroxidase [Rhodoblastus sp.]|uniref:di-heme-cytochrome C peroxidase n=1 Tax=Rhodoblastus sp. TaxID=1962975 RepID=UPI003F989CA2